MNYAIHKYFFLLLQVLSFNGKNKTIIFIILMIINFLIKYLIMYF